MCRRRRQGRRDRIDRRRIRPRRRGGGAAPRLRGGPPPVHGGLRRPIQRLELRRLREPVHGEHGAVRWRGRHVLMHSELPADRPDGVCGHVRGHHQQRQQLLGVRPGLYDQQRERPGGMRRPRVHVRLRQRVRALQRRMRRRHGRMRNVDRDELLRGGRLQCGGRRVHCVGSELSVHARQAVSQRQVRERDRRQRRLLRHRLHGIR